MISKNLIKGSLIGLCVLSLSGCASIMGNAQAQKFDIVSNPSVAKITVKDIKSNKIVIENNTPFQIILDKKQDIYEYNHQNPFFVLPISSATGEGLKELKFNLLELLNSN